MFAWLKQTLRRAAPPPVEPVAPAANVVPASALARKNEADRLADAGDVDASRLAYREAVTFAPDYGEAWNNLALTYLHAGVFAEAEACLQRAVAARPGLVPAWVNLASVQEARGDRTAAEQSLRRALAADPGSLSARNNLGTLVCEQGRFLEAEEHFRAALSAVGDDAGIRGNLALALRSQGRIDEALAEFQGAGDAAVPDDIHAYLLTLNYSDRRSTAFVAAEHRRLGARLQGSTSPGLPARRRDPARPLRVGYVSADFGFHVVSFVIEPVLAAHDPVVIEVYCYFTGSRRDTQTERVAAHAACWRDIGAMDDDSARALILADELDIAVDLSGHTGGNRLGLFARRIAPVQATWLGYPNTTGLPAIDFRITDAWADPPGMTESLHTEALVRLPSGFIAYQPRDEAPDVTPPPCRRRGHVTFGCFSNPAKLSDACLALWARVLAAVPTARLLVKARGLEDPAAETRFAVRFVAAGGDRSRLDLVGWTGDFESHLERYAAVDIALDSHPYHGTTTTCEALWMGVPVVTLAGSSHVSRVGVSLLARAGHAEWVAADADAFVRIAADLAADDEALTRHRAKLRETLRASLLTDVGQLARSLEAAYAEMITIVEARCSAG